MQIRPLNHSLQSHLDPPFYSSPLQSPRLSPFENFLILSLTQSRVRSLFLDRLQSKEIAALSITSKSCHATLHALLPLWRHLPQPEKMIPRAHLEERLLLLRGNPCLKYELLGHLPLLQLLTSHGIPPKQLISLPTHQLTDLVEIAAEALSCHHSLASLPLSITQKFSTNPPYKKKTLLLWKKKLLQTLIKHGISPLSEEGSKLRGFYTQQLIKSSLLREWIDKNSYTKLLKLPHKALKEFQGSQHPLFEKLIEDQLSECPLIPTTHLPLFLFKEQPFLESELTRENRELTELLTLDLELLWSARRHLRELIEIQQHYPNRIKEWSRESYRALFLHPPSEGKFALWIAKEGLSANLLIDFRRFFEFAYRPYGRWRDFIETLLAESPPPYIWIELKRLFPSLKGSSSALLQTLLNLSTACAFDIEQCLSPHSQDRSLEILWKLSLDPSTPLHSWPHAIQEALIHGVRAEEPPLNTILSLLKGNKGIFLSPKFFESYTPQNLYPAKILLLLCYGFFDEEHHKLAPILHPLLTSISEERIRSFTPPLWKALHSLYEHATRKDPEPDAHIVKHIQACITGFYPLDALHSTKGWIYYYNYYTPGFNGLAHFLHILPLYRLQRPTRIVSLLNLRAEEPETRYSGAVKNRYSMQITKRRTPQKSISARIHDPYTAPLEKFLEKENVDERNCSQSSAKQAKSTRNHILEKWSEEQLFLASLPKEQRYWCFEETTSICDEEKCGKIFPSRNSLPSGIHNDWFLLSISESVPQELLSQAPLEQWLEQSDERFLRKHLKNLCLTQNSHKSQDFVQKLYRSSLPDHLIDLFCLLQLKTKDLSFFQQIAWALLPYSDEFQIAALWLNRTPPAQVRNCNREIIIHFYLHRHEVRYQKEELATFFTEMKDQVKNFHLTDDAETIPKAVNFLKMGIKPQWINWWIAHVRPLRGKKKQITVEAETLGPFLQRCSRSTLSPDRLSYRQALLLARNQGSLDLFPSENDMADREMSDYLPLDLYKELSFIDLTKIGNRERKLLERLKCALSEGKASTDPPIAEALRHHHSPSMISNLVALLKHEKYLEIASQGNFELYFNNLAMPPPFFALLLDMQAENRNIRSKSA